MSMEKMELRSAAMHEVGVRLDDALEAAKAEMLRAEGAVQAGQKAMERAVQLLLAVDKENAEGGISDEQRDVVKKYLAKCHAAMKALYDESNSRVLLARGMVLGMDRAVKTAKQLHDQELSKGTGDVVPVNGEGRSVGDAPKMSIKQRRLAEESASTASAEAPVEPIAVPTNGKRRSKRTKKS